MDHFDVISMDFVLNSTGKAMWEYGIKWGRNTFLKLDYVDDLIILDENVSKIKWLIEILSL